MSDETEYEHTMSERNRQATPSACVEVEQVGSVVEVNRFLAAGWQLLMSVDDMDGGFNHLVGRPADVAERESFTFDIVHTSAHYKAQPPRQRTVVALDKAHAWTVVGTCFTSGHSYALDGCDSNGKPVVAITEQAA
jgi:hypothetical protein